MVLGGLCGIQGGLTWAGHIKGKKDPTQLYLLSNLLKISLIFKNALAISEQRNLVFVNG